MEILAQTEENDLLDTNDLMIQNAYDKQMPLYVSSDDLYGVSKYIAAIPALSHDQVIGMLVIEKMPFMSFNKDTLISSTVLVSYMFDELHKLKILANLGDFLTSFQDNFRFEAQRLHLLNKQFNTESTILIFKSYNKLTTHLLQESLSNSMRDLDIMSFISKDDLDVIAILFPFSDKTAVKGFMDRVYKNGDIEESTTPLKHSIFSISETDLIEPYITGKK